MEILSINKFFWRKGGSEAVFFGEMDLLEKNGHHVIPFSMKSPYNIASEYSDFFIDEVDYANASLLSKMRAAVNVVYSVEARKQISRLLELSNPVIAHFHIFQHQISPSVFGPLRKKNIPIILTLHDLKPICPNYKMYTHGNICESCKGGKFYHCALNKCTMNSRFKSLVNSFEMYIHYLFGYYRDVDKYIAVSHFYRQKMIEFGFPEDKIAYLPNYVDLSDLDSNYSDHGYGLFFGRLSEEKGLDIVLDAAKRIHSTPIIIAGNGPLENHLANRINKENINNVSLIGHKSGEELKTIISNAAFSIVSSVWYENCPMSILESFALKTPVIGARIGGIPELIHDGVDGLTFTPGNPEDLSHKINMMMCNNMDRKSMGRSGREKVARHFSPQKHLDGLLSIYQEFLAEN